MSAKAKLPAKLSDLIDVAVKDLSAVERSKKYKVDMDNWHYKPYSALGSEPCHVCLAGAVVARSLKADINEYISPNYYPDKIADRLSALNCVRGGALPSALALVDASARRAGKVMARTDIPKIPEYSKRKSPAFKSALRKLARILRQEGL